MSDSATEKMRHEGQPPKGNSGPSYQDLETLREEFEYKYGPMFRDWERLKYRVPNEAKEEAKTWFGRSWTASKAIVIPVATALGGSAVTYAIIRWRSGGVATAAV